MCGKKSESTFFVLKQTLEDTELSLEKVSFEI